MKVEGGRVVVEVTRPLDVYEVIGLTGALARAQMELAPPVDNDWLKDPAHARTSGRSVPSVRNRS